MLRRDLKAKSNLEMKIVAAVFSVFLISPFWA